METKLSFDLLGGLWSGRVIPALPVQKSILGILFGLGLSVEVAIAQTPLPVCQPPRTGEYLLLVPTQTPETQAQVRRTLPTEITLTVCDYLDQVVTRIGGFTSLETANSWSKYMTDIAGLPAFVARPATTPASSTPSTTSAPVRSVPASTPQAGSGYNPRPLGSGYAVLVDYLNRPEIAAQVRALLGQEVGLVSYGQRPYLLAVYTPDANTANTTLRTLSDRGFFSMLVDSRKVVLLRSSINR